MNEKRSIERGTAEGFLGLYNQFFSTDFKITEMSDAPDVRCSDPHGNLLDLEITSTEDRPGDIKALLGRSNARTLEALRAHVERVAQGKEKPQFSSLSDEVTDHLVDRLKSKMQNDYGPNAALVVRDSSGVDWDWDDVALSIRERLTSKPRARRPSTRLHSKQSHRQDGRRQHGAEPQRKGSLSWWPAQPRGVFVPRDLLGWHRDAVKSRG